MRNYLNDLMVSHLFKMDYSTAMNSSKLMHLFLLIAPPAPLSASASSTTESSSSSLSPSFSTNQSKNENYTKRKILNENEKMEIVNEIGEILQGYTHSMFIRDFTIDITAFFISNLLQIAENEKLRSLQAQSLIVLKIIILLVHDSKMLLQLLPGISSSLLKICRSDYKIGSSVPCEAIRCLRILLLLTVPNDLILEVSLTSSSSTSNSNPLDVLRNKIKTFNLEKEKEEMKKHPFYQMVEKLSILIRKFCEHSDTAVNSDEVKYERVLFCGEILNGCYKTLSVKDDGYQSNTIHFTKESANYYLFSYIVSYLQSENENIKTCSVHYFNAFKEKMKKISKSINTWESLICPVIESELLNTITLLPSICRKGDSNTIAYQFLKCRNFVEVIGTRLNVIVDSSPTTFTTSLTQIFEFKIVEIYDVKMVNNESFATSESTSTSAQKHYEYFRKIFVHLEGRYENNLLTKQGIEFLESLGENGDIFSLMDYFMTKYRENEGNENTYDVESEKEKPQGTLNMLQDIISSNSREQRSHIEFPGYVMISCLFILSKLAQGGIRNSKCHDNLDTPKQLLSFLLSLSILDAYASVTSKIQVQILAVTLEVIGDCAEMMKESFLQHIKDTIFPVLDKLGHPSRLIRQTAIATLYRISIACAYKNGIHDIINANIDYLVNGLVSRLPYLDEYPNIPSVVSAVFSYLDLQPNEKTGLLFSDVILRDLLESTIHSLDLHLINEAHVTRLLQVLLLFVNSFNLEIYLPPSINMSDVVMHISDVSTNDFHLVDEFIKEVKFWEETSDVKEKQNEKGGDDDDVEESGEAKWFSPETERMYDMMEKIILRVQHFVMHPNRIIKRATLNILSNSINFLGKCRKCQGHCAGVLDSKVLQIIHKIWQSFSPQFVNEKYPVLALPCIDFVESTIQASETFMTERFCSDAWPVISKWLSAYVISGDSLIMQSKKKKGKRKKNIQSMYSTSDLHDLIDRILDFLINISKIKGTRNVLVSKVQDIAVATKPLMMNKNATILTEKAQTLWKYLTLLDGDAMWAHNVSLSIESNFVEPPPELAGLGLQQINISF